MVSSNLLLLLQLLFFCGMGELIMIKVGLLGERPFVANITNLAHDPSLSPIQARLEKFFLYVILIFWKIFRYYNKISIFGVELSNTFKDGMFRIPTDHEL